MENNLELKRLVPISRYALLFFDPLSSCVRGTASSTIRCAASDDVAAGSTTGCADTAAAVAAAEKFAFPNAATAICGRRKETLICPAEDDDKTRTADDTSREFIIFFSSVCAPCLLPAKLFFCVCLFRV
jgi:hypothetical protein